MDVLCLRVPRDVGQRLLQHPVDGGGRQAAKVGNCLGIRHLQVGGDAAAAGEIHGQPFHRLGQSQVVQHQRTQVGRNPARRGHRRIERRVHPRQFFGHLRVPVLQLFARPGQVHLQRGELLAELVVEFPGDPGLFVLARLQHLRRKLAQLGLRLAQGVLGVFPAGDVAQDHGIDVRAVLAGLRDRSFDRKLRAVAPQSRQDRVVAHPPGGDAGGAECLDVPVVGGAKALREEPLQRPADGFIPGAAEHLLRRQVEEQHVLLIVHHDHRIHRGLEDRGVARLSVVQRGLHPFGHPLVDDFPPPGQPEGQGEAPQVGEDRRDEDFRMTPAERERGHVQGEQQGPDQDPNHHAAHDVPVHREQTPRNLMQVKGPGKAAGIVLSKRGPLR